MQLSNNPKFNQYIESKIQTSDETRNIDRFGVVLSYNPITNTATVLMSSPNTETAGDILENVPCPVIMGIQMAAPEPGRPCWVCFKGNRGEKYPMISHYFNHDYQKYDYNRHTTASSGIPYYMLSM